MGETKANAQVAGFLFNSARTGNVTAQIFWLKTRARWRETPMELRHSGSIARRDVSELTDQELMDRIFELQEETGLARMKTIGNAPGEESDTPTPPGTPRRLVCPAR